MKMNFQAGKMSTFQMIVMGVLGFSILSGVVAFSLFGGREAKDSPTNTNGVVVIWGTHDSREIREIVDLQRKKYGDFQVTYVEKRPDRFDTELIEALASGRGPDAVLLPQDSLLRHYDKLALVPFESYTQRQFRDTYIQEGELYVAGNGIVGFPFIIDPLVLFWNRSIFSSEAKANPPRYWEEFQLLARDMTRKDGAGNIIQATVALGEYDNVDNAKEILSAMIFQNGNNIVSSGSEGFTSVLNRSATAVGSVLSFYTSFADPVKTTYTWNRSMVPSQKSFVAGNLAMYIGFGSEVTDIREQNPNLNFDIALLPQPQNATNNVTFGRMQALSILRSTKNYVGTLNAINVLSEVSALKALEEKTHLPPVRRDMFTTQTEAFKDVLYKSALISRAWMDPDRVKTDSIFRSAVNGIISGSARTTETVTRMNSQLGELLR